MSFKTMVALSRVGVAAFAAFAAYRNEREAPQASPAPRLRMPRPRGPGRRFSTTDPDT
ncbi:hypothetical protein [Streptomyces sp. NPDC097610]|uniref:hypothetical protein n=1 Tax=Streptomyces sp. NPDC097610 TaxID=3157227 RepID=UPI00331ACC95